VPQAVNLFAASQRTYFVLQHTIDTKRGDKKGVDRKPKKKKKKLKIYFLEEGTGNRARTVLQ
jgi:hypothetical protein